MKTQAQSEVQGKGGLIQLTPEPCWLTNHTSPLRSAQERVNHTVGLLPPRALFRVGYSLKQ